MKYKATFSKQWTEYGEVEIDADDEDEARERAMELLIDGDDSIEWDTSMQPGDQDVESVEEVE